MPLNRTEISRAIDDMAATEEIGNVVVVQKHPDGTVSARSVARYDAREVRLADAMVLLGNEDYTPTAADLTDFLALLTKVNSDPEGSVVVASGGAMTIYVKKGCHLMFHGKRVEFSVMKDEEVPT